MADRVTALDDDTTAVDVVEINEGVDSAEVTEGTGEADTLTA